MFKIIGRVMMLSWPKQHTPSNPVIVKLRWEDCELGANWESQCVPG